MPLPLALGDMGHWPIRPSTQLVRDAAAGPPPPAGPDPSSRPGSAKPSRWGPATPGWRNRSPLALRGQAGPQCPRTTRVTSRTRCVLPVCSGRWRTSAGSGSGPRPPPRHPSASWSEHPPAPVPPLTPRRLHPPRRRPALAPRARACAHARACTSRARRARAERSRSPPPAAPSQGVRALSPARTRTEEAG
jgi:hypothetical protein